MSTKLRIWNPWDPTDLDRFNKIFNNITKLPYKDDEVLSVNVNLSETESEYTVEIPVPGLKPEDINVSLEDRYLTVSGRTSEATETSDRKYHIKELTSMSFTRTVLLPGNVDTHGIDAKCDNGILKISLPKMTKSTSTKIEVR